MRWGARFFICGHRCCYSITVRNVCAKKADVHGHQKAIDWDAEVKYFVYKVVCVLQVRGEYRWDAFYWAVNSNTFSVDILLLDTIGRPGLPGVCIFGSRWKQPGTEWAANIAFSILLLISSAQQRVNRVSLLLFLNSEVGLLGSSL